MDLSPSSSSLSLSIDASSNQGLTGSPLVGVSSNREPELVVLCIILEPEGEGEEEEEEAQMASNIRPDFNKRQRKRLSEALSIAALPTKKTRTKAPH